MSTRRTKRHAGGRPTKYLRQYVRVAGKLAEHGASMGEIADALSVDYSTLYVWKDAHPEFFESIKTALDRENGDVRLSLYQRARGVTVTETRKSESSAGTTKTTIKRQLPPDPTAMIFWLANRDPEHWKRNRDGDHAAGAWPADPNEPDPKAA